MRPVPASNPSPAASKNPTRLLLVEDHAPLADAMVEFLQASGLEVRLAKSGQEAMEVGPVFHPEIVLCDMRLPDMSGLDLAKAHQASGPAKKVLFVIHTAVDDAAIRTLEREISTDLVDLFISKPLTMEKLDRLLHEFALLQQSGRARSGSQGRR